MTHDTETHDPYAARHLDALTMRPCVSPDPSCALPRGEGASRCDGSGEPWWHPVASQLATTDNPGAAQGYPRSASATARFELWSPGGTVRFSAGDRVLWRDPFGIGGIVIAASISGAATHTGREPSAVALNVEPSEVVRAVAEWARESSRSDGWAIGNWPKHMLGDGGRAVVIGEEFARGVYAGKIRHAGKDEEGRVRDEAELCAMPEWWATRREDLERQTAEEGSSVAP